jgi:S-layer protein (TIGR01567 family)
MSHTRAIGACLLLILVAAALSFGGLAETPNGAGNAGDSTTDGASLGSASNTGSNAILSGNNPYSYQQAPSSASAQLNRPGPDRAVIAPTTQVQRVTNIEESASAAKNGLDSTKTPGPESTATAEQETSSAIAAVTEMAQEAPTSSTEEESAPVSTSTVQAESSISSAITEASSATEAQSANQAQSEPEETVTPDQIKTEEALANETGNETGNATESQVVYSDINLTEPENQTPDNQTDLNATDMTALNETAVNETGVPSENVTEPETTAVAEEEEPVKESTAEENKEGLSRIWREGINSFPFTWSPKSFSGFFYDLEDEVGTENLTIRNVDGRTIKSGDLVYETKPQGISFEFGDWGSYQVIGFMADKYFAGYTGIVEGIVDGNDENILDEGQLRKVLIDDDSEHSITTGSVLPLEEGYELRIKEIDLNGNKVYLALAKEGEEIDSKVVTPESGNIASSTYTYKVDIGGKDVPILLAHVNNVFASAESSLATVNGLFQISDAYTSVESGDEYEAMKVIGVDSTNGIEMENDNSISLRKGRNVKIMGDVSFQVADADMLRFAPYVERTGTYEVRGSVINPEEFSDGFTWDPYNFEGFYYDIDDDVGTETLKIRGFSGNSIQEGDLIYETTPQPIGFKFEEWGNYSVIGFLAEKYFAGYNDDTKFTGPFSIIGENELRKVLVDSDDEQTITTGSVLGLEEGYELRIKEVDLNGNKVWLALAQDGEEVDSKVVTPSSDPDEVKGSTYTYKVRIGSEDVPLFAAHVNNVFRGTEADLATIDGIFQISDNPSSVEQDEKYGRMKVEDVSDGITMRNDGTISLNRGRTLDVMDSIKFVVADADSRNFAPVAERTSGTDLGALNLTIPQVAVDEMATIKVSANGNAIDRADVLVDGEEIGLTNENGTITYMPKNTGTFDVVAKKSGYSDATGTLTVSTVQVSRVMAIDVPPMVLKGETFLITVTGGMEMAPIKGAEIFFDGSSIGTTSEQGTITYSSNATGEFTVRATAEGYDEVSRNVTVLSSIQVTDLNVSQKSTAGRDTQVKVAVRNAGSEPDSKTVELRVNGRTVDTRDVALGPGEDQNLTFNYKPMEPGVYSFEVDGKTATTTAEKASTNTALIALILVLIIVIGAGFYLYRTGELDKLRGRFQKR